MRCVAVLFLLAAIAPGVAHATTQTVVSLTFDDGIANQFSTRSILAAHGMLGTFYVNTNTIGQQFDRMTWAQLGTLNADGHEIAGHTLDHVHLPDLAATNPTEARRQVCEDRGNLVNRGFIARSFAYPWGEFDGRSEALVRDCGYSSGRAASGLHRIVTTSDTRPYAYPIPPPDPYAILIPCCIDSTTTLTDIQNHIVQAENHVGGWVVLLFHSVCDDGCAGNAVTPALLSGLLDWLQLRAGSGTVVKTVTQVITGDTATPATAVACNDAACSGGWYGGSVSVSLSAADTGSGVSRIRYTLDGSEPTVSSPTYTGPFAVSATTTVRFRAWDNAGNVEPARSQLIQVDGEAPVSTIACDGSVCSSQAYATPVSVTLAAADNAGGSGVAAIRYTLDGSEPTAASTAYSGPFTVSTTTTVRFRAWDNAGNAETTRSQLIQIETAPADTQPPVSAIACNGGGCSTGWYVAPVTVALSATDDQSGVAVIRYTLDGSEPTSSSTPYSAPFTLSSTTTVKFRAWDNAGNAEATRSQLLSIDGQAPTSAIACNGSACSTGWYGRSVSVTLSATDDNSGLAVIRYTLDGSDPNAASPVYAGALTVSATTTVKFRAWDNAGNAEATRTQQIRIDAQAPTVAITSPANGSTVKGNVKITASASDALSGVVSVSFYANGVLIGTKVGAPFFVSWQTNKLKGTFTLTAVAVDAAGNSSTSASISVTAG
jgi:peptidoglycan/xylan/chitin deacetylase (PgdA/CDA1 family)